ncbi:MAG: hypothetical protein ACRD3E_01520 [Terriglobales bacterium]
MQPTTEPEPLVHRVYEQCEDAAAGGVADREGHYRTVELDYPSTAGDLKGLDYLTVGNDQRGRPIF